MFPIFTWVAGTNPFMTGANIDDGIKKILKKRIPEKFSLKLKLAIIYYLIVFFIYIKAGSRIKLLPTPYKFISTCSLYNY